MNIGFDKVLEKNLLSCWSFYSEEKKELIRMTRYKREDLHNQDRSGPARRVLADEVPALQQGKKPTHQTAMFTSH